MCLELHHVDLSDHVMRMVTISDEELERLSTPASHACPNCDGDITIGEHEAAGVCTGCYFGERAS